MARHQLPAKSITLATLIECGLINSPMKLYRIYKGNSLTAIINRPGTVTFNNQEFKSISMAASVAKQSVSSSPLNKIYPHTNGWTFWKFSNPFTKKIETLDKIREVYRREMSK